MPHVQVTMVVRDYVLSTLIHNLAQLVGQFCPIRSCPSRIWQTVEQSDDSQQILVGDHHGKFTSSVISQHKMGIS